jgi:hypothetical protein
MNSAWVTLARSVWGLAGLGDGPMSPSHIGPSPRPTE